jgi:hypothetical protein
MSVRAKFKVTAIKAFDWSSVIKEITLTPQYDHTIEEDRRFFDSTPSGEFRMNVNNPKAIEQLVLGKTFYIDLTEAELPGQAASA